jgi:DNA-directed RNA polymerase subunit RPC12/RpoP
MEVRGERKCTDCGTRWTYYETGSIECPDCGSVRSVGVGERTEHTAGPADLELGPAVDAVDEEPLDVVAEIAVEQAREYLRAAGFVHAGELLTLSDDYLVAAELRRVGATLSRAMRVTDDEERYFLSLLRAGVEGERPPPDEVPESLRGEHGLAVAAAADAYASDIRRLHDDPEPAVAQLLSSVRTRRKRIEALDGDVAPTDAEALVRALRDLGEYLRTGEETALARATSRFDE